jgi:undecaprenyl diphosphate synthase
MPGDASASNPIIKKPRHVAIIMDGNGRWAERRKKMRFMGHKAGVEAVRETVEACAQRKIEVLTLFAFSSENWRRPEKEVGLLMDLFVTALEREARRLHKNNVRLRIIGEKSAFSEKLQKKIKQAESLTENNTGLTLNIAANYGGRWDMAQAARQLAQRVAEGELRPDDITPEVMASHISLHDLPEPDLFIRTGGEMRVSNFMLWQLAYAEMYFTDILWPDFNAGVLDDALESFAKRQRRFGKTGQQVGQPEGA